eukprot:scaffold20146_cov206-Isochrysis_galbana.AAC.4
MRRPPPPLRQRAAPASATRRTSRADAIEVGSAPGPTGPGASIFGISLGHLAPTIEPLLSVSHRRHAARGRGVGGLVLLPVLRGCGAVPRHLGRSHD